jgi:tetratricopeptide (TPR) repeat protein
MADSNLEILFQSLEPREKRLVRLWLLSPVHNKRSDLIDLYSLLESGSDQNDKEFLWSKVFPDLAFDDARWRQTTFLLFQSIKDALAWDSFQSDPLRELNTICAVFNKKKLDKLFQRTLSDWDKKTASYPRRNVEFLYYQLQTEKERYQFTSRNRRNVPLNLQTMSDAMDLAFVADKLRLACHMLAHQTVYQTSYESRLLEEVVEYVRARDLSNQPAINAYFHIYNAYQNPEDYSSFSELKKILTELPKDESSPFDLIEKRDLFIFALNFCIARINKGKEEFIREAFDLYRSGFQSEIFLDEKTLSRYTFLNAIINAGMLGEFDWAESTISKWSPFIDEQFRTGIVLYARGYLHYEQKQYKKAMNALQQVEFNDSLIALTVKAIQLRIYYETNEWDLLDTHLDSMRLYLSRHKIIGYHQASYKNIIRLARKLMRLKPVISEKNKFKEELLNTKPALTLRDRNWFFKMLEAV